MSQDQLTESHSPRPQWRSHMGFILAAIGSAVGLGNIWRFSYLCYENGGGAFLVPYFIALLTVGIPLMILELGIGHRMRGSAPLSLAKISRRWEWLGWWAVIIVMFGIMLYYAVIIAWCLRYVFYAANLAWGADPNAFFFNEFLKISSGPFDIGGIQFSIILSLLAVWVIHWFIVFFGVQNGVERANKIFMPLLFILILILVAWSLSLEGAKEGVRVYLTPDFSKLSNVQIWIDAFSQIFFTLSLGFGIMIAYASYLPKKVNIVKDALIISLGNAAFSFVAGFAVFGTLGYMAYSTNQPVADVVSESIGLAFVAYPQAISLMPDPTLAKLFGVLFFSTLVIAGISSGISILEAFGSAIIDKFNCKRKAVITTLCVIGFFGGIVFTTNGGLFWLDIADHFITHYGLVTIGLLECIAIGWIWKASALRNHINQCAPASLSALWDKMIMLVTPAILIWLLIIDLIKEVKVPYGEYPWMAVLLIGPVWLLIAFIASFFVSMYPWEKDLEIEKKE